MSENQAAQVHEEAPTRLELEQGDIYSKYLLYSKSEILFVLRAVLQKGSMITVYFDRGQSFLLTSLIAIDTDRSALIFDLGSDNEMNERALKADRLLFTTSLDKVKIQFSLKNLDQAQHGGRPAFRGAFPDTVLRLQRREYYRLSTPIATPVRCRFNLKRPDGAVVATDVPLLDISGGGVGLMVDPDCKDDFQIDTVFTDCRIDLPEEGLLVCTMIVRNAFDVTTKSGNRHLRVGCEYQDLPGTRLTMIQRYITRVERERKARMSGMS
ncbi:MAG: flagellar brake protein [Pseudomonadota bacterium]|nr:flagellar brake protein [Pseudomonadota bacterium]